MPSISSVLSQSGVAFGTSGARGLVTQFTPQVCMAFTQAFVDVMRQHFTFNTVAIAIDNRPSSYAMAQACASSLIELGLKPIYFGVVPTPALAYTAMQQNIPAIMVTGSHIPFDRNGLKFYRQMAKSQRLMSWLFSLMTLDWLMLTFAIYPKFLMLRQRLISLVISIYLAYFISR